MNTLPIISLAKMRDLDGETSGNEERKRLYDACLEHGFFYLKDHDISADLVQQTIDACYDFFQLPLETKQAYGQDKQCVYPKITRGYVPLQGETLNMEMGPDMKELFDLGIEHPPSDKPFTGPTLMPDDTVAPNFSRSQYQLQEEVMTKIVPHLLRAFAAALDLDKEWFAPYFDDPVLIQRTIYYPAGCGLAGKHTDSGIFTILIQEHLSSPSLRVYAKDAWIDASCLDNIFLVNLGDMLQFWTNGLFTSTPHQVIHKVPRSRISLPFFVYPNIDATIKPIGTQEQFNSTDLMLKNFDSIWVTKTGAGRARELK